MVLCGLFLNGWCEEEDDETDKIVSGYRVPNNRVYPYMVYTCFLSEFILNYNHHVLFENIRSTLPKGIDYDKIRLYVPVLWSSQEKF